MIPEVSHSNAAIYIAADACWITQLPFIFASKTTSYTPISNGEQRFGDNGVVVAVVAVVAVVFVLDGEDFNSVVEFIANQQVIGKGLEGEV